MRVKINYLDYFPRMVGLKLLVASKNWFETKSVKPYSIFFRIFVYRKTEKMTAIELKKLLINRIIEINDVSFLNAIKTILDTKTQSQIIALTPEQRYEIQESKKEIKQGLFIEQVELDKEFNKWLNAK